MGHDLKKSTNGQVTGKFRWTFLETWGSNKKKIRCDFAVGYNDVENHMKASCQIMKYHFFFYSSVEIVFGILCLLLGKRAPKRNS